MAVPRTVYRREAELKRELEEAERKKLYLSRLQKWREEKAAKQKPLAEIKANRQSTAAGQVKGKSKEVHVSHLKQNNTKPVMIKQRSQQEQKTRKSTIGSKSQKLPSRPISSQNAAPKKQKQADEEKNVRLDKHNLTAEEAEIMKEKLKKWKEEKSLSVKKGQKQEIEKKSEVKDTSTECSSTTQDAKKFKTVKSRLFDYLHKPSANTAGKTSSSDPKKTDNIKANTVKPKKDTKCVISVKGGLKRRHSEVGHGPPKKPAGILKRKSCIPSIESCGDNETDQLNHVVDSNTGSKGDDVFLSTNYTKKDIPVAMVTPGTARSVRFISPEENLEGNGPKLRKTPVKPAEMSDQLNDWLKSKGRTPSKFRHLMCFHAELDQEKSNDPQTKSSLSVEELTEQMDVIQLEEDALKAQEKLSTMLEECMILFDAGCPVKDILPWLDEIYRNIPLAKTSAQFYECKARVVKSTLDLDQLLEVFETALINGAQPRDQIAKTMSESIKYVSNEQLRAARKRKGTPRRSGIQEENMFQSSAIVYTVSEVTPFTESKLSKKSGSTSSSTGGDNCKVITPVRRSTRRSLQNLPSSLKDKKDMYKSLSDVDTKHRDNMLFQPNIALDNLLAEAEEES